MAAVKSWITGKEKHLLARRKRWDDPSERQRQSERLTGVGNSWVPTSEQRLLPGTLYLVRYLDGSGTHFKLGITRRTLRERLGDKLISIIHLHNATLGECFDLEQDCLRHCKQQGWRYSSSTTTELIHPDGLPYLLDRLTALASVA
jgi:hypothetical protein